MPLDALFRCQVIQPMQFTWGWEQKVTLTLYILGYFYTVFVPGGGGKFAPLSKNRLVSDRSKIFCMLKLFFVKFLKIKILRF